jgi:cyclohexanone monooxygenase
LIDVTEEPIERFTASGIIAGGCERPLDTLVLATGFDALTGTLMRLDLRGRGGLTIQQKWRDGPDNYLGLAVHGFPNLFNIAGPGSTAVFTSVIAAIEHHVDWIAECVLWLRMQGKRSLEATAPAEAAWMEQLQSIANRTVFMHCNSWYLGANIPGKPRQFMMNAGGFPAYANQCAQVAANGYEGFAVAG